MHSKGETSFFDSTDKLVVISKLFEIKHSLSVVHVSYILYKIYFR